MNEAEMREEYLREMYQAEMGGAQPAETPEPEGGFSMEDFQENAWPSVKQLGSDVANIVAHPYDTALGVADTVQGAIQKVVPYSEGKHIPKVDAIYDYYKKRIKDPGKALSDDPAGTVTDVLGLVTGGTGLAAKVPGLSKLGGISKAGMAIDPVNAAINVGKSGVKAMTPKGGPASLMESASKMSTAMPAADRRMLAQTMIDENILPNEAGVVKSREMISKISQEIDAKIATLDKTEILGIDRVNRRVQDLVKTNKARGMPDPRGDTAKIRGTYNKWFNGLQDQYDLKPSEMQTMKKEFYQRINYNASNLKGEAMPDAARKAMAKGAKESIESLDPTIKPLNDRAGRLLELAKPLEKASGRIANRDVMGIGIPIKMGAGATAAGDVGAAAGLVAGLADTPMLKARTAGALGRNKKARYAELMADNSMTPYMARQIIMEEEQQRAEASPP